MTRLVVRLVLWLSLAAVLVVAGGHTVYYLIYWEWNRAAVAGIGFVAGLVIAMAFLLLARLQRLERGMAVLLATQAVKPERPPAEESDLEPRPDFPWLSKPPVLLVGVLAASPRPEPEEAVFIPVFLAAGLLLSLVAGAVERVAAAVQFRSGTPGDADLSQQWSGRSLVLLPLIGLVVVVLTVGGLYLVSHYWSRPLGSGVTTLTVQVDHRGPTVPARDVVEAVGRFCALDSGVGISFAGVTDGVDGTTLLRVEPLLDDAARRRYVGCVEDAQLEWHRLTVTDAGVEDVAR